MKKIQSDLDDITLWADVAAKTAGILWTLLQTNPEMLLNPYARILLHDDWNVSVACSQCDPTKILGSQDVAFALLLENQSAYDKWVEGLKSGSATFQKIETEQFARSLVGLLREQVTIVAANVDRTEKPKQSSYPLIYLMYLIPGAAAGQLGKSIYLASGFNGSSASVALVTGASAFLGFLGGYALFNYVQTKIAKNRGSGILLSVSISIGLSFLFFMTTVFVSQSATQNPSQNIDWNKEVGVPPPAEQNTDTSVQHSQPTGFIPDTVQPASPSKELQQTIALAEQGNAEAQAELGYVYATGTGVIRDYQEALKWLRLSADQGYYQSQDLLGLMYSVGHGVPIDNVQEMKWYFIAKAGGSTTNDGSLQIAESISTPAQIAEAQRMAREWWAAHPKRN